MKSIIHVLMTVLLLFAERRLHRRHYQGTSCGKEYGFRSGVLVHFRSHHQSLGGGPQARRES